MRISSRTGKPVRRYTKKIIEKAGKIADTNATLGSLLYTGDPVVLNNLSAKELIDKNNGWAAICCNKLAAVMSSIELKLFYAKNTTQKLVRSCKELDPLFQNKIKKNTNNLIVKEAEEIVEILDHPLRKLLFEINGKINYSDWISLNSQYVETIGNSYNLIDFKNGKPTAIYPLLGEYMEIEVSDAVRGTIGGYIYKLDNKTYKYKPENILHFVNYNPGNNVFGRGSLEICLAAILREKYYDLFEFYTCKNFSLPSFLANFKSHKKLTEKEKEDLYRQINNKFGNPKNAGKPIITESDALEIIQLQSATLRDMNFCNGRVENRRVIAAAYGIPTDLLDTSDANRASSQTAITQFLQFTVFPKMLRYVEMLNQNLIKYYDDTGKLFIWFDNTVPTDPETQSSVLSTYTNAGILTIDEARKIIGYEGIPEVKKPVEEPVEKPVEDPVEEPVEELKPEVTEE